MSVSLKGLPQRRSGGPRHGVDPRTLSDPRCCEHQGSQYTIMPGRRRLFGLRSP